MDKKRGKIISLESCDAAGKSTQSRIIERYFIKQGKKVKKLHFPMYGHNQFSELISKFLRGEFGNINEVDPLFVANIYAMDRYMYKNQLVKDLNENDIVILDRYVFSNFAFQGAKIQDVNKRYEIIDWIWKFEFNFLSLPYPDLILFFDVPIDIIEKRLNIERKGDDRNYLNGKKDIHEQNIQFQSNVRDIYLEIKNSKNYYIIDTHNKNKILKPNELFKKYKNLI